MPRYALLLMLPMIRLLSGVAYMLRLLSHVVTPFHTLRYGYVAVPPAFLHLRFDATSAACCLLPCHAFDDAAVFMPLMLIRSSCC